MNPAETMDHMGIQIQMRSGVELLTLYLLYLQHSCFSSLLATMDGDVTTVSSGQTVLERNLTKSQVVCL